MKKEVYKTITNLYEYWLDTKDNAAQEDKAESKAVRKVLLDTSFLKSHHDLVEYDARPYIDGGKK